MIYKSYAKGEIPIDKKDVCRYAFHKNPSEDDFSDTMYNELLEKAVSEISSAADARTVCEKTAVSINENSIIDFGSFTAESRSLSRNMKGCSEAIIFGATLGYEVERLLIKNRLNTAYQLFLNAAATSLLESVCTLTFEGLKKEFANRGKFLRPRFSPGYGDFSLTHQRDIFRILDLERKLGITLTENLFMVPAKSVTAICAISEYDDNCETDGCEICSKRSTCPFCRIGN